MVHRSDAYFSILYQWYQSTNRFRTAFECEYDYFLFFTNGTNGTNLWHGFRVFMSVNICSLHMLYQSTNRFRTALTITVFKMPDAVYKWFTNRLRSFPFVPVVRIVRLLWQMVIIYPMVRLVRVFWRIVSVCVYCTCVLPTSGTFELIMPVGLAYVAFELIIHVWFMYTVPIKTEAIILGKSAFVGPVPPLLWHRPCWPGWI